MAKRERRYHRYSRCIRRLKAAASNGVYLMLPNVPIVDAMDRVDSEFWGRNLKRQPTMYVDRAKGEIWQDGQLISKPNNS